MAWYEGTMTSAAGALISVLDNYLLQNSYWSIYDGEAGTNAKVYRNYDSARNSNFYVLVNDNQASYAIIELWEGWDNVNHQGVGQSLKLGSNGSQTLKIFKPNGGFALSVKDHRFIFINLVSCFAFYIGQLNRYDVSKNMPVFIGGGYTTLALNPLGARNYDSNIADCNHWRCLFAEDGSVRTIIPYGDKGFESYESATPSSNVLFASTKTSAGTFLVFEHPVANYTSKLTLGTLDGVCYLGRASQGLANNYIVSVEGTDWLAVGGGGYWCLIRKD